MEETWVWPLGWEDPLKEEIATQSSSLAWEIPWTEETDGLWPTVSQRVWSDLACIMQSCGRIMDCEIRHGFMCACMPSHFSRVQLFATIWTIACQAPLSMGCSSQDYWSTMPFSRGSSRPRDRTWVSSIAGTREAQTLRTQRTKRQILCDSTVTRYLEYSRSETESRWIVLEMNDDDCKTLWIYLIPLNSTRKMDKMANFGFCVFYHNF